MSFKIPDGILAQHIIALGKTGSGKSSKMRVLVEHLLAADQPVCIIDPKGDWWGIKSSADGKKAGFPIVIFGGEHADVPLNERAGAHVAELIATGNRSCLIDLGGWMVGERTRFFIEFASSLFKHARGGRHLVIDEIHNFAPQGKVLNPDAGKMLHWANRLASEGRGKGITIIAASQRPQKVAKDFLTSCETLIACKVIHKLDRDAIKDWVDGCADPLKGKEVITSLAQLKKPEAWVWCPEIEYGPVLLEWPFFKTYDSFKPQGVAPGRLKGWADVDLDEVKSKLAAVVAEAKAHDPAELKKRIAELEKQLRAAPPAAAPGIDKAALHQARQEGFAEGRAERGAELRRASALLMDGAMRLTELSTKMEAEGRAIPVPSPVRQPSIREAVMRAGDYLVTRKRDHKEMTRVNGTEPPVVRKIIEAIHRAYPVSLSFEAAARRVGVSSRSSAYRTYRDAVARSAEFDVVEGGKYRSKPGFCLVDDVPAGASVDTWVGKLPPAYGKMLRAIHAAGALDKDAIAELAGVSKTSSGLGTGLRELISLQLVRENGGMYECEEGL